MTFTVCFAIIALAILLYFRLRLHKSRSKNCPPGPGWRLPVVGHLPLLGDRPYETMLTWKGKYGPVISVQLGSFQAVFLNSSTVIREALKENVFSSRTAFNMFKDRCNGVAKGIFFTDLNNAVEYRSFIGRCFRDFGVGKLRMESILTEEAIELVVRLKTKTNLPVCLKNTFHSAVLNSLWCIVTGEGFRHDDPKLLLAIELMNRVGQENVTTQGVAMFIPWLAEYFPWLIGYRKLLEPFANIQSFVSQHLQSLESTYTDGFPRGLYDMFIEKMNRTSDVNSPFHHEKDELRFIMMDLFVAGTETTSTALSWACLLLAVHQEVQLKMQKELDTVVGHRRHPTLEDRPKMPFISAVMNEAQRFGSVTPVALFHRAGEDAEICGYFVKKDTVVVPNTYAAHYDETVWGDPKTFRPERFLDKNGRLINNKNLIPFSVGKRVCLGESLAKDEFFLFLSHIFQVFHIDVLGKVDINAGSIGVIRSPKQYKFVLKLRSI